MPNNDPITPGKKPLFSSIEEFNKSVKESKQADPFGGEAIGKRPSPGMLRAKEIITKVQKKQPLTETEASAFNNFVESSKAKVAQYEKDIAESPTINDRVLQSFNTDLGRINFDPSRFTGLNATPKGMGLGYATSGGGYGGTVEEAKNIFDTKKNAFGESTKLKLSNVEGFVNQGKFSELFKLANSLDYDLYKEEDPYFFNEGTLKGRTANTANLVRSYASVTLVNSLLKQQDIKNLSPAQIKELKKQNPDFVYDADLSGKTIQEVIKDPKLLNRLGKRISQQLPGTALYSKAGFEGFEELEENPLTAGMTKRTIGGKDNITNYQSDQFALDALKTTAQLDFLKEAKKLYNFKNYNKTVPDSEKIDDVIAFQQQKVDQLSQQLSTLNGFDLDKHLRDNYKNTYQAENYYKEEERARNEGKFFTNAGLTFKAVGKKIWNSSVVDVASTLLYYVNPETGRGLSEDVSKNYWMQVGNSYKFDREGYTIGLDENLQPVQSSQFRWKGADGKVHYNFWAILESGAPVGVDMMSMMGAGSLIKGGVSAGVRFGSNALKVSGAGLAFKGLEATKLGSLGAKFASSNAVQAGLQSFAGVYTTTYPKYFAQEYNKFKDPKDAADVAAFRSLVEAATESIIPNTPEGLGSGAQRLFPRFFGTNLKSIAQEGIDNVARQIAPGISYRAIRYMLDSRAGKRIIGAGSDLLQEGIVEEELSLLGNSIVDEIARNREITYYGDNEFNAKGMAETAIESLAGMLLTVPLMGGGTKSAENQSKISSRFQVANNPEIFRSLVAEQYANGEITKEQAGEKLARINKLSTQLQNLPAKMSSIRDLNTLLEDKELQQAYYEAINEKEALLNYVPTEEEVEQYQAQLESINKTIHKTEKLANIYDNLTVQEKKGIIEKTLQNRVDNLIAHDDMNPVQYEQMIQRAKADLKQNPGVYTESYANHIKALEANRTKVMSNFFNFLANNNEGLTFEQIDYKMNLLALNEDLYDENAVAGLKSELGKALFRTAGPIFGIENEDEFIEELAKNYVTSKTNERPLVSEGKSLYNTIQEEYINDNLFKKFVAALPEEERFKKTEELKQRFWTRVVELKKQQGANPVFPNAPSTQETAKEETEAEDTITPEIEDAFIQYEEALEDIDKNVPEEERASRKVEVKATIMSNLLGNIAANVKSEEELFSHMKKIFDKLSPETADDLLEAFKQNYEAGSIGRNIFRVLGKGTPANFIESIKSRLQKEKGETEETAETKEEGKAEGEKTAEEVAREQINKKPTIEEKIELINRQIDEILGQEVVEKERLAFLETLLAEAQAALEEQIKSVQKEYNDFKKITAPKKSKRAENIEKRRQELQKELRSYFDQVNSIADRIREVESTLKELEATRANLQDKANYYKGLVTQGTVTEADIFNKIFYLDRKVKNLNKLIDSAKGAIEKLKRALSDIVQILTGQRGYLEAGSYPSKAQIDELRANINFADSTEQQLEAKEQELTNLIRAVRNADKQLEFLFELLESTTLEPGVYPDLEIIEVKPEAIQVTEEFKPFVFEEAKPAEEKPKQDKPKRKKKGAPETEPVNSVGATKNQLKVRDKLTSNPTIYYTITLTDGTTVDGMEFSTLGTDKIEGVNNQGELVIINVNELKSARKAGTAPNVNNPSIESPEVQTDSDEILLDFEEKDARIQYPQSGFITSSDEFDKANQEVEDDYSQAVNEIFKNVKGFPNARISSMRTYLEALMGPNIVDQINDILESEITEEEKLTKLTELFTDSGKLIFYKRTLVWWAKQGAGQFAVDLVAPAFYVVDSRGRIQRYSTKGPDMKGYPIHRNLPIVTIRAKQPSLADYQAIKVDINDPVIQAAIVSMDLIREELRKNPSLVYKAPNAIVSPGAYDTTTKENPYQFIPVGDSQLLVVGTDISETSVDYRKGYVVSEYNGEYYPVSFPKLTKEQIDVIKFIVKGENLPEELRNLQARLKYLNTLVFTNPYGNANKLGFRIENNQIVPFLNNQILDESGLEKALKQSFLNFYQSLYSQYTPYNIYEVKNGELFLQETTSYKDFINSKAQFVVPTQTRINRKIYFGQPVVIGEELTKEEGVDQDEPFVDASALLEPVAPIETVVVSEDDFVPMDIESLEEAEERLKQAEKVAPAEDPNEEFTEDDFNELFRSRSLPKNLSAEKAKEAYKWFLSSDIKGVVNLRKLFNVVNSQAYAAFTRGMITLYKGSDYTDLYHEGWHVFSQYFLTIPEKIALYEAVRKKLGNVTYKQAEEYLAEGFRNYALEYTDKKPKNFIEKIYKKINNFIQSIFNHPDFQINKMFEALYTGNISQYAPTENNFMFKELFSERPTSLNLKTPSGTTVQFSDRDFNELLSNLDATLIHQGLLDMSKKLNRRLTLGTVLANKRNQKLMNSVYANLKQILENNLAALKKDPKPSRLPQIERYEAILNNWEKVVKAHSKGSPIFVNKAANYYDDTLTDNQDSDDATRDFAFNKSVEEFSSISRAKPEVIALVASIGKYKKNKLSRTELLGLPVLDNFTKNWKLLSSELAGITSYAHMLYKIEQLVPENPQLAYLLESLPKYKQKGISKGELGLMSAFMNTFSEPIIDMMKVRLNVEEVLLGGRQGGKIKKVMANVIKAQSRASNNLLKSWGLDFKASGTNMTVLEGGEEVLDMDKVFEAYKELKGTKKVDERLSGALELAQATGLFFEDNVLDYLSTFAEKNQFIESVIQYVEEIIKLYRDNTSIEINDPINQVRAKVGKSLNFLAELAVKADDEFFADEASNPEGNYIFKKNQFHYMSKVASWINQPSLRLKPEYKEKDVSNLPLTETHEEYYPSFGELLALHPELGYLDFTRDAFSYGSSWLKMLFDVNGNRILTNKNVPQTIMKVAHFGGTEYEESGRLEGKKTTNLYAIDKLLTDINGFLLKGIQENLRLGDKSSAYTVYFETTLDQIYDQKLGSVGMKTSADAIVPFTTNDWKDSIDALRDHAVAEVLAINQARNLAKEGLNYKNYDTNGKKFRFFSNVFDEETINEFESNIFHSELDSFSTLKEKVEYITNSFTNFAVEEQLTEYIEKEAEALKNYIIDELNLSTTEIETQLRNFLPNIPSFANFTTEQLLLAYTYYDTMHRIEQFKFFYRDPAFYKNTEDIFKRLSKYSATGTYMNTDQETLDILNSDPSYERKIQRESTGEAKPYTNKIRASILEDELVNSVNKDEYVELIKKKYNVSTEKAKKMLAGYGTTGKGADQADGQGAAVLDSYRFIKLTMGLWLPEHEEAYNKEVEIYKLYKDYLKVLDQPAEAERIARQINNLIENQTFVFEPQKPQYAGTVDSKLPITTFHKFSIYPITPSLTLIPTYNSQGQLVIEETDMFTMAENMYRDNIDYFIMASGVKDSAVMGGKGFQKFYNKDGKVNTAPLEANELYASFFKEQVQIEPHTGIHSIIFPTQFRGLLFLDEAEQGVFADKETEAEFKLYKRVVNELISVEKEKLKRQLGATKNDFSDVSIDALAKFLQRELASKDVSADTSNFFIVKDGQFEFDYNGSTERRTIAAVLEGIVYNRIIKQKLSGTHYIQGASLGNTRFKKATARQKLTYGVDDLKFYSKDYQYCDVKVAFSDRYKPLLNIVWKGERIGTLAKLNSLLKDDEFFAEHGKKVTLVGCRVPVQGINSMDRLRILQFLPPSAGTLMLLPEEIVVKTGSDFDIDKMFVFEPNIDQDGNYYPYTPGREEVQLRQKAASLTKRYDNKKRKLSYIFKALDEKVEDESLKEIIKARKKTILENIKKVERGLLEEDIIIEEGDKVTAAEKAEIDAETTKTAAALKEEDAKILNRIDKLFEAMRKEYEELDAIRKEIKIIKLGRANKLVDIISQRLGNPEILDQLIMPNDNPDLQAEKDGKSLPDYYNDKTKYIKGLKAGLTSAIKSIVSNQIFKSFLVGKSTLGVAAKMNKTHQITAQMNMYDNTEYYLLRTNNGKSLSKLEDTKGRKISSIFSQYINGFVDVAKGAWISLIGADRIKGPIQMYIVKRGTAVEEAISFTLQPKINQYTKALSRNNSIFMKVLGLTTTKREVTEDIFTDEEARYLGERGLWVTIKNRMGDYIFLPGATMKRILDVLPLYNPTVKPINIYSSDKNGFEKLSNFAEAPFTKVIEGKTYSFRSPEHYYQANKALIAGREDVFKEILEAPTGFAAQQLGRSFKLSGSELKYWNEFSQGILEAGMIASFENNPNKLKLLLSTGEAELTHKSTKEELSLGKWENLFPQMLMKIRKDNARSFYTPFTLETMDKELTEPTMVNQLIYLAQYKALELKSSDFVNWQQLNSPDTKKETSLVENIINEQERNKLKNPISSPFTGLDTFENTVISVFENLVEVSKDLQINTNDLFKNDTVRNALVEAVMTVKSVIPAQDFDYKKVSSKVANALMQYIMHNYYKTDSGANFYDANNLELLNLSSLSLTSPKNVQLAKRFKSLINRGNKLENKIDLKKEFPVVKFLRPYRNSDSNFFTFILTAGTNLTKTQKEEFQKDFVELLNFNHPDMEYAAEVRDFFKEFLEIMYVSTGFQYFEANINSIIPSEVYARKATMAIKEFLKSKTLNTEMNESNFQGDFILYNYPSVQGEILSADQKTFNAYRMIDGPGINPLEELNKGEEHFIKTLSLLDNNGVYLQLIQKRCE